jgi:MFS family permease
VSFLVLFAADTGLGRGVAGLLLVSVSAAAIIGRVVSGVVVDRYGRDPLSVTFTMFACCSIALSLLVQATPVTVIVGALTMGAMGWAWHGTLTLAVTGLNRDEPVWAVGVIMSGVFAGAVTGPLLVGLIAAQASLSTAWSLCSVLSVLPLVLVVAAVRTRGDARELPVAARSQPQHASASSGA